MPLQFVEIHFASLRCFQASMIAIDPSFECIYKDRTCLWSYVVAVKDNVRFAARIQPTYVITAKSLNNKVTCKTTLESISHSE